MTEAAAAAGALVRALAIEASGSFLSLQATARQLAATLQARQRSLRDPVPGPWITLAAALAANLARDPRHCLVHTDPQASDHLWAPEALDLSELYRATIEVARWTARHECRFDQRRMIRQERRHEHKQEAAGGTHRVHDHGLG